jgi:uncharacterized protein (DUF433 family)
MAAIGQPARHYVARDPHILSGEPILAGTRIPVRAVVVSWHFEPDFDRLREAYPSLSAEAIEAALAYYATHRAEIERYMAVNGVELD